MKTLLTRGRWCGALLVACSIVFITLAVAAEQPPAKAPPVVLKRAEITRRQMSLMSIMPQRMLDGLTRDEIADLVAYVAARGDPQAPEVQPISTEE